MTSTPTVSACPNCKKRTALCVCATLAPVEQHMSVLILQHPQEQDKDLGTAWLLHKILPTSILKVGLSWPSLTRIIGRPADPKRWAVLYLGTVAKGASDSPAPLTLVNRQGAPLAPATQKAILSDLEGLILLDGTWAQAKTLWWRNAWLLKAHRMLLRPNRSSLYGKLRKEPRKGSISTLEAAAFAISHLENNPDLYNRMTAPLKALVEAYQKDKGNS